MLGGLSFKSSFSDGRGVWVNVREINYLIGKGIIQVDEAALKEFVNTIDEEFNVVISRDSLEDEVKDMLGRELDEKDRLMIEAVKRELGQS